MGISHGARSVSRFAAAVLAIGLSRCGACGVTGGRDEHPPRLPEQADSMNADELKRIDRAIDTLRSIGYPCQRWSSTNGKRVAIIIDAEAAERLIQVHQPGFRPKPSRIPARP